MLVLGDTEILANAGRHGEATVHASLTRCFEGDREWIAFYGLPVRQLTWSLEDRDLKPLVELDFLVFHRDRGCLLLEVKGGLVRCEDGVWQQGHKGRWRPMRRHPLKQALGALKGFLNRIEHSPGVRCRADAMLHRALLAMPGIETLSPMPIDLSEQVVAFRGTCEEPRRLEAWLESRFEMLAREFGGESRRDAVSQVLDGVVMPRVRSDFGLRSAANRLAEETTRPIVRPGRHDDFVRERLQRSRVLVEGAAGTGKSIVAAIRIARHLEASPASRALLVTYNRLAAEEARRMLEPHFGDRVLAIEYHAFCRERALAAGVPWEEPRDLRSRAAFFKQAAPSLLELATQRRPPLEDEKHDLLVADEAQDLNRRWLRTLVPYLRRGAARWGLFDPRQLIFAGSTLDDPAAANRVGRMRRGLESFFGQADRMLRCYRMSRQIHAYLSAHGFMPADVDCDPLAHEGEPPIDETVAAAEAPLAIERAALHAIDELGFSPAMVLVQSHHRLDNRRHPLFGRLGPIGGGRFRLAELAADGTAAPDTVPCTTIQRFKGCERPCSIVVVSGQMRSIDHRDLLYTALTRARLHLHVLRVEG